MSESEIKKYRRWVRVADGRGAEEYAGQINAQQERVIKLEGEYRSSTEELRRLHSEGFPRDAIAAQTATTSALAARLREAEHDVSQMRALARFRWPKRFRA